MYLFMLSRANVNCQDYKKFAKFYLKISKYTLRDNSVLASEGGKPYQGW